MQYKLRDNVKHINGFARFCFFPNLGKTHLKTQNNMRNLKDFLKQDSPLCPTNSLATS